MTAGTARIYASNGSLTLPVDTAYDRQLLVDHVLAYARRRQPVQIRALALRWRMGPRGRGGPKPHPAEVIDDMRLQRRFALR